MRQQQWVTRRVEKSCTTQFERDFEALGSPLDPIDQGQNQSRPDVTLCDIQFSTWIARLLEKFSQLILALRDFYARHR